MPEEGGDCVQAHAAVDGLSGQGVPQLMGGDGADACCVGEMPQGFGDPVAADRPVVFEQKTIRA